MSTYFYDDAQFNGVLGRLTYPLSVNASLKMHPYGLQSVAMA